MGLGNYVLPTISNVYAKSGTAAMQRQVHRSCFQFAALLMPVTLVLAVWGEGIVTGIYGKAYAGSASVVFLLALNMLISSLMYPYSQGLFSMERAKADAQVNVVTVVLLFTLGIAAVKSYSALGAAAAMLVSTSIAAIIRRGVFAREVSHGAPERPPDTRHMVVESSD
jgi:O-antigen/teichoic acid export membrane protein